MLKLLGAGTATAISAVVVIDGYVESLAAIILVVSVVYARNEIKDLMSREVVKNI